MRARILPFFALLGLILAQAPSSQTITAQTGLPTTSSDPPSNIVVTTTSIHQTIAQHNHSSSLGLETAPTELVSVSVPTNVTNTAATSATKTGAAPTAFAGMGMLGLLAGVAGVLVV